MSNEFSKTHNFIWLIHSGGAVKNPCLLVVCDVNCTVYRPKHAILPPGCV